MANREDYYHFSDEDSTHGKYVHICLCYSVQKVTFLEKYIMENVNRSIKEGGRRFSIPL